MEQTRKLNQGGFAKALRTASILLNAKQIKDEYIKKLCCCHKVHGDNPLCVLHGK